MEFYSKSEQLFQLSARSRNRPTNERKIERTKSAAHIYCILHGRTMGRRVSCNFQIQLNRPIKIIELMSASLLLFAHRTISKYEKYHSDTKKKLCDTLPFLQTWMPRIPILLYIWKSYQNEKKTFPANFAATTCN